MAYSAPTVTGVCRVGTNDTVNVSMTSAAWSGTIQATGNSVWASDNLATSWLACNFIKKALTDGAGTYTLAAAAIA